MRDTARMRRVRDYIERNLDGDLSLETVARVAAFSPFHFHRQFAAFFGMSLHQFVHAARLCRAAQHLADRQGRALMEIAFDAGFQSPDSFGRAFRQAFGQAPGAFRLTPDWGAVGAVQAILHESRSRVMGCVRPGKVIIVPFSETRIVAMAYQGRPAGVPEAIARFVALRRVCGLWRERHATYTIFHDPGVKTIHLDLCAALTGCEDFSLEMLAGRDARLTVIPGGRCACLRVVGQADDLSGPAAMLYRDWLPSTDESLRDFPLFCQRIAMAPDVARCDTVTDVYLPLKDR